MKKTEHSRVGNYNVQVPKIGRGTVATEFLAQLIAALPKVIRGGRGIHIEYFAGGYNISATGGGRGGGGGLILCQISSIGSDYLVCDSEIGSINVARPHMLRYTGLHGVTVNYPNGDSIEYTYDVTNPEWKRQADDGSTTITQILTPNYVSGEYIHASVCTTGLEAAPTYQDVNTCGRHWAEEP